MLQRQSVLSLHGCERCRFLLEDPVEVDDPDALVKRTTGEMRRRWRSRPIKRSGLPVALGGSRQRRRQTHFTPREKVVELLHQKEAAEERKACRGSRRMCTRRTELLTQLRRLQTICRPGRTVNTARQLGLSRAEHAALGTRWAHMLGRHARSKRLSQPADLK